MAKKTNGRSKLGWIVGGIWIGVIVIGGSLLFFLAGFSPAGAPGAEASLSAELATLQALPTYAPPTATFLTTFTPLPTEFVPTSTPAMIPTRTPGSSARRCHPR